MLRRWKYAVQDETQALYLRRWRNSEIVDGHGESESVFLSTWRLLISPSLILRPTAEQFFLDISDKNPQIGGKSAPTPVCYNHQRVTDGCCS